MPARFDVKWHAKPASVDWRRKDRDSRVIDSTGTSKTASELLSLLFQHSPTPVPIARLTTLLGARRGTVESRIKSLRRKLGPGRLVSRGSLGYELVAE